LVVAGCASIKPAHASPEDLFGYGPRGAAMGGTGAASASGFEAAYSNPALLSRLRERKLTLGYGAGTFGLSYGPEGGATVRKDAEAMRGLFIGVDLPLPFAGVLKDRLGLGLAFYTPSSLIVRGRLLYPEKPQFLLLPDRAQSLTIRTGLGVDVSHGLRLGLGFAALAEIVGTVLVATDASGRVGTRVEDQLVATYAPTFSAAYDLPFWKGARVGAAFRGTLDARFAVSIDATKLSSLNIPVFNIAGLAQYDPAQIAVELAHEGSSRTVAVGVTYKRWSSYKGPIEPTIPCPAGEEGCGALVPPSVAYSDTVAVRAGLDQGLDLAPGARAHVRAGGFFETTPLPSTLPSSDAFRFADASTGPVPTRYYDASRLAGTLGFGLSLSRPLPPIDLDTYAQVHWLLPRTVSSDLGDGSAERTKVGGRIVVYGLLAGVKF
jgi:long-chain fatty acid transport protein